MALGLSILFASCFETEEKTTINTDNSGSYNITMDISGIMQQLKAFGGSAENGETALQKKDTVILFKDYTDTSTILTASEKEMLKNGAFAMHIDEEKDEMKFAINIPFKNVAELPLIKTQMVTAMEKINLTDKMMGDSPEADQFESMQPKAPGFDQVTNPLQNAFTLRIDGTRITNKLIDSSVVDKLIASNPSLQSMKQMSAFLGEVNYKITYVLPATVKNYKGSNAVLSDDKKTITFTSSLSEMFNRPASLEYDLAY